MGGQSGCSFPCAGDGGSICGGSNRVGVWWREGLMVGTSRRGRKVRERGDAEEEKERLEGLEGAVRWVEA